MNTVMWRKKTKRFNCTEDRFITVERAVKLIRNSADCNTRQALSLLAVSTRKDPVGLFEGKGMLWLLED